MPGGLAAQWPGEVEGRAVDAVSGRPLEGVLVEAAAGGLTAVSDAAGRFFFAALPPGRHALVARRVGYATLHQTVEVENGRRASVRLALEPLALSVRGLRVEVDALEGRRVEMGRPATTGARTAADLVDALPGVAVTRRGPGGPVTISIRGSGAGAVLVLLDGVPVTDPVTGEADLSAIPASVLAAATVLPGARSARYGAGAEGGVVLLESRIEPEGPAAELAAGSLGRAGGELSLGGGTGLRWSGAMGHERLDGDFEYVLPAAVGGASGVRRNADLRRTTLRAAVEGRAAGELRVRALHDRQERGLPGRAFAPSPAARQDDRRSQLSLAWTGTPRSPSRTLSAWLVRRVTRHRDPRPPAGLPYDDATHAVGWGIEGELRGAPAEALEVAFGVDVEGQAVDADALLGRRARTDAAIRTTAGLGPLDLPGEPTVRATGRLHRDGRTGEWRASHEIALAARRGPLGVRLAHRSAWTPPALADLFFREGVAVRPNPDLRAERIPSELEAGLDLALRREDVALRAGASAWRGDVRGMVVWAPDFRFVWSPRNVDVRRRGLETWGELEVRGLVPGTLVLDASWTHARATYDRDEDPDLQLAYRPRHSGSVGATWSGRGGGLALEGRYTGLRYPAPARVNALAGFWAWDAAAARTFRLHGWTAETRLRVERLLGSTDALVFGFPHPGRTLAVELAVQFPRTLFSDTEDP